MSLQNKLAIIADKYKFTTDSYMVMNDFDGWTNGYIADLASEDLILRNKVEAKHIKNGDMVRFITDKEKSPKVSSIIATDTNNEVTDIMPIFIEGTDFIGMRLISGEYSTCINPALLSYFIKKYNTFQIFIPKENNKPIQIVQDNGEKKVIGLIMPILNRE